MEATIYKSKKFEFILQVVLFYFSLLSSNRILAEIVGSNPTGVMDVFRECCVFQVEVSETS